jgi:hypothetical protein
MAQMLSSVTRLIPSESFTPEYFSNTTLSVSGKKATSSLAFSIMDVNSSNVNFDSMKPHFSSIDSDSTASMILPFPPSPSAELQDP